MKRGAKVVAIVQARIGSTRLPGKTMKDVVGRPAISHLMNQLAYSRRLDALVLATTMNTLDDPLVNYGREQGWQIFRGSEEDVLDRYYKAATEVGCAGDDAVVRVTGDDILIDPEVADQVIDLFFAHRPDVRYASNNLTLSYPFGADVEILTFEALEQAQREADKPEEREHVTPYVRHHPEIFPNVELRSPVDYSHIRIAIDYPEDLAFMRQLLEKLYESRRPPFHVEDLVTTIQEHDLRHEWPPGFEGVPP